jgi:predicted amidohydrolase YtcJ
VGDAAVDLTLDAYEEAMEASPRPDPRHRIEHCVLTTKEATRRIRDLGVVVSTNPAFIRMGGDYWPELFGEARTRRAMVMREWLDTGVPLAIGSDAPTTPWYTPQATLVAAVARTTASNTVLSPEQRITIREALRAHTMGAAYAAHAEKMKGSIEVGKLADLAVWADDPYTTPLPQIFRTSIVMTLVGGRVVHPAEA